MLLCENYDSKKLSMEIHAKTERFSGALHKIMLFYAYTCTRIII